MDKTKEKIKQEINNYRDFTLFNKERLLSLLTKKEYIEYALKTAIQEDYKAIVFMILNNYSYLHDLPYTALVFSIDEFNDMMIDFILSKVNE